MTAIDTPARTGALAGVRVLDLAQGTAGSLAAMHLADYGADVVAVVDVDPRLDAGPVDPDWLAANRGKRLAVSGADPEIARTSTLSLAADADVVVVDGPDTVARLGARAHWPDVVVLETPPYARHLTPWTGGSESAPLLNGILGLSGYQASYSGAPVDSVYPYLTTAQGLWAATCALSALLRRSHSGLGQRVTVSGLHAALVFGGFALSRPADEPDPDRRIGPGGLNPMYTRYRAGDGTWFFVGGLGPKFSDIVVRCTGMTHLLGDPRIAGRLSAMWQPANSAWVMAAFAERYAGQSATHWVELFEANDVPATLLMPRSEWFAGEQVTAMGQRLQLTDPVLGAIAMPGAVVSGEPGLAAVRSTRAAEPLEHLRWQARPEVSGTTRHRTIAAAAVGAAADGPLAGYRVASLGSYVAGPYAAALLAELGAEVVKVEPLFGDPWRVQGFAYNRGVRSLAVDATAADGREVLLGVLASCDLVLDNFRQGVMTRLGVDHAQLSSVDPSVATFSVTAYGERGPLAPKPGYDTVLQAASGMMSAQGGVGEPVVHSLPANDHIAAIAGAFGCVLTLAHREWTGQAVHASTSLAATSVHVQFSDLLEYAGRPAARLGGRDFAGPSALDRVYPTGDRFVRLQARQLDRAAWRRAGLDLGDTHLDTDVAAEIARVLAPLDADDAVARLDRAGVAAVRVRRLTEVTGDPVLHDEGLLAWFDAANGARLCTVDRLAHFTGSTRTHYLLPPGLGEHSVSAALDAGLGEELVKRAVLAGALHDGDPIELVYLPPYR